MATINNFEDLKSWQSARSLCDSVFQLTQKDLFSKDWSLKDQINRSSGSVMDNIAEGFDRNSNKEFRQFLFIANGSASEVKSQLYRAFDRKYISKEEFENTFEMAVSTSKLIGGLLNYLRDKDDRKM